jgi:S1-C subfamily serine protease
MIKIKNYINTKKMGTLFFLIALLVSSFVKPTEAAPLISINGKVISFDVEPIEENGRTLVPLRTVFESFGMSVVWDGYTRTVTASNNNIVMRLQVGNNIALVNNQQVPLEVPPREVNSRVLVPLRFVGESLGATVVWDEKNNCITIKFDKNHIQTLNINANYQPSEIFKICNPAVISINLYDKNGTIYSSASGVIIDINGKIATNYHVIQGAYSAKIKLADGTKYDVTRVINYDEDKDIAILQISGSNFPYIQMGDSDAIVNGQQVVAIGSPKGLDNTITDGLVSSKTRLIEEKQRIQISTPISTGSSGGALINYRAQLIGITCSGYIDGQNLNFAVPVNQVKTILDNDIKLTLTDFTNKICSEITSTGSTINEQELNDDHTTANNLNLEQSAKGSLDNYDVDYYKIHVSSTGKLTISGYTLESPKLDLGYNLYDVNGKRLKYSSRIGNTSLRTLTYKVIPGYYYVSVFNIDDSEGKYVITARMVK